MRIRALKPEFWTSEDVAALSWDDRLVFIGLWSYVDDNGVGRDVEKLIVAALFALDDDPRETLAKVSRGLQRLAERGLVARYTVEGRPFLYITGWPKHQKIDKPNRPRYPLPTCADAPPEPPFATPSREPRETLAPVTGEQGNRGTGEQRSSVDLVCRLTRGYPQATDDDIEAWRRESGGITLAELNAEAYEWALRFAEGKLRDPLAGWLGWLRKVPGRNGAKPPGCPHCTGGWLGLDDEERPIPCPACRPRPERESAGADVLPLAVLRRGAS